MRFETRFFFKQVKQVICTAAIFCLGNIAKGIKFWSGCSLVRPSLAISMHCSECVHYPCSYLFIYLFHSDCTYLMRDEVFVEVLGHWPIISWYAKLDEHFDEFQCSLPILVVGTISIVTCFLVKFCNRAFWPKCV